MGGKEDLEKGRRGMVGLGIEIGVKVLILGIGD